MYKLSHRPVGAFLLAFQNALSALNCKKTTDHCEWFVMYASNRMRL